MHQQAGFTTTSLFILLAVLAGMAYTAYAVVYIRPILAVEYNLRAAVANQRTAETNQRIIEAAVKAEETREARLVELVSRGCSPEAPEQGAPKRR